MEEQSKLIRYNEYLNVEAEEFRKNGIYNGYIWFDTPLYVNPKLLEKTNISELKNSDDKIIKHFEITLMLLKSTQSKNFNDNFGIALLKHFHFPEPNGIGLGTSYNSIDGNGLTGITAQEAMKKTKDILGLGIEDPQIYKILSLIQENISVDRISDMIANIIYEDLLIFTENMIKKMRIKCEETFEYNKKNYVIPKRPNGKNIILLPMEILSEIPIEANGCDIYDIIQENSKIKTYFGEMFEKATKKYILSIQKSQMFNFLMKDKTIIEALLSRVKSKDAKQYNFMEDILDLFSTNEYMKGFLQDNVGLVTIKEKTDLFNIVGTLLKRYKFAIESLGINEELYYMNKNGLKVPKNEITSHRMFILMLEAAKLLNGYSYDFEPKVGNGQIEFKIFSKDNADEIVLVEFKLNKNKIVHGYKIQLPIYMKRFEAKKAYYVIIEIEKSNAVEKFYNEVGALDSNKSVIVIDGLIKNPPSTAGEEDV